MHEESLGGPTPRHEIEEFRREALGELLKTHEESLGKR